MLRPSDALGIITHEFEFRHGAVKGLDVVVQPVPDFFGNLFHECVCGAFFLCQHLVKLLDSSFQFLVLFLMFFDTWIIYGLLEGFFFIKMVLGIIRKEV